MLKPKTWQREPFNFAHIKMDGHRLLIERRASDGEVRILTRKPQDITAQLEWHAVTRYGAALQIGEWMEGELWVPGHRASDVVTAIQNCWSDLRFDAFCCGQVPEHADLHDAEVWHRERGIPFLPWWFADSFDLENMQPRTGALRAEIDRYIDSIEGWVFKDAHMLGWRKWKAERTIDLVVTGFRDGRGKYEGFVGALLCSVNVERPFDPNYAQPTDRVEVASVSGMDEDTRFAISESNDLGRVVEVKYQYVGNGGRLRHPRFVRWRDDKQASECTADQDPALVSALTSEGGSDDDSE
jgi:hypothetical protein